MLLELHVYCLVVSESSVKLEETDSINPEWFPWSNMPRFKQCSVAANKFWMTISSFVGDSQRDKVGMSMRFRGVDLRKHVYLWGYTKLRTLMETPELWGMEIGLPGGRLGKVIIDLVGEDGKASKLVELVGEEALEMKLIDLLEDQENTAGEALRDLLEDGEVAKTTLRSVLGDGYLHWMRERGEAKLLKELVGKEWQVEGAAERAERQKHILVHYMAYAGRKDEETGEWDPWRTPCSNVSGRECGEGSGRWWVRHIEWWRRGGGGAVTKAEKVAEKLWAQAEGDDDWTILSGDGVAVVF
ncbi:hypothetical protein K440DRAFT_17472 [Wilcoxina mikolae CBS 423.85]|nr:hypothetical protein K440DRAFT_17472 [Wilcoxina mikolae CBS 423.85]